jgi:hypothetical protein
MYNLLEESVKLKKGNCAVYVTTRDKACQVQLPKASDCYGTFVFVYLTSTVMGAASVEAASGDNIAKLGVEVENYPEEFSVTSVMLSAGWEYILLYSSGLYWHELVSNIAA